VNTPTRTVLATELYVARRCAGWIRAYAPEGAARLSDHLDVLAFILGPGVAIPIEVPDTSVYLGNVLRSCVLQVLKGLVDDGVDVDIDGILAALNTCAAEVNRLARASEAAHAEVG
jgi:hypothetical protein